MKSIKPFDYQEIAITKVIEGFETQDRGQLIMPCGTGKTYVSMWVHERLDSKHTLVLVPSLALLRQTKNEWIDNLQKPPPYLCICSEESIDNDNIEDYPDLIGSNVTSNIGDIIHFLNSNQRTIIFCTYHSLDKIILASQEHKIEFDLAICDEAHKTAAPEQGFFTFIHNNVLVRAKKRLYMTATPRIWDQVRKKNERSDELINIIDMNNPKIFGKELFYMSFKEAIERGLLVNYRIVAIGINDREIHEFIEENKFFDNNTPLQEVIQNYALNIFTKKYNPSHTISFHSSIKKAQSFMRRHIEYFNKDNIYHINSMDKTEKRRDVIKDFLKQKNSIITNARCLGEGVDIPNVDSIYFCDPKQSKVDIIQAIGRALRLSKTNEDKIAYIVMPLFHALDKDLDSKIDDSRFRNIMNVLRSLSSHDDRITDSIRNIRSIDRSRTREKTQNIYLNIDIIGKDIKYIEEKLFDKIINNYILPWKDFYSAREYVHTQDIKTFAEWKKFIKEGKKPIDIPSKPDKVYKNSGWINWKDFFGLINNIRYLSYHQAKDFIKPLRILSSADWKKCVQRGLIPDNIPPKPLIYYKHSGWTDWNDFLGRSRRQLYINDIHWDFHSAREYVRKLYLKKSEWDEWIKDGSMPIYIPMHPNKVYWDDGWTNWKDWLEFPESYKTYDNAKKFVKSIGIKSRIQWIKYRKNRPRDLPSDPERFYRNKGWKSWGEFCGTNKIATTKKKFRSYKEASKFAKSLNITSTNIIKGWTWYCQSGKKPNDIPSDPAKAYKDKGWKGYHHFLSKEEKND